MTASGNRRAAKQVAEMEVTSAELMARALETGKVPSRRWRVQGSPAGSSHLLSEADAVATQKRYGGAVVEVLPLDAFYVEHARRLPACTHASCRASAGVACSEGGRIRAPHANRKGKPQRKLTVDATGYAACTHCDAKENEPCRGPSRRLRKPHKGRLTAHGETP